MSNNISKPKPGKHSEDSTSFAFAAVAMDMGNNEPGPVTDTYITDLQTEKLGDYGIDENGALTRLPAAAGGGLSDTFNGNLGNPSVLQLPEFEFGDDADSVALMANTFAAQTGQNADTFLAIKQASIDTGYDFEQLLVTLQNESGFDTGARAATSSASGMAQFIDGTWRDYIDRYGDELEKNMGIDLDNMSDRDIMDLRYNAYAASFMSAKYNMNTEAAIGSDNMAHTYMGYVFGNGGARELLEAGPHATAADILPEAASANRSLFYNSNGSARTVGEVEDYFENRIERSANYIASIHARYEAGENQIAQNTRDADNVGFTA